MSAAKSSMTCCDVRPETPDDCVNKQQIIIRTAVMWTEVIKLQG